MEKWIPILVMLWVFILWALLYWFLLRIMVLGIKSKKWPSIEGVIVASRFEKVKRSGTGLLFNAYVCTIIYEYTLTGRTYANDLISFGDLTLRVLNRGLRDKRGADKIVTIYPEGKRVSVYYDPQNPGQAILKPGIGNVYFILWLLIASALGLFFLAIFSLAINQ
jgi:hypothetical protein